MRMMKAKVNTISNLTKLIEGFGRANKCFIGEQDL
jgi:hypothetical protein